MITEYILFPQDVNKNAYVHYERITSESTVNNIVNPINLLQ